MEHSASENRGRRKLKDIDPLEKSRSVPIRQKENLSEIVEGPLLSACEELYEKNISTVGSSANKKDIEAGKTYILLDFDALSAKNKSIAKEMGEVFFADGFTQVRIDIPISPDSTFQEVERASQGIVDEFSKQRYTPLIFSVEELRKEHNLDESFSPEDIAKGFGLWYEPTTKQLFYSQEQYKKAIESQNIEE